LSDEVAKIPHNQGMRSPKILQSGIVAGLLIAGPIAQATNKQNNTDPLSQVSSWVGTAAPGINDTAAWTSIVTGANSASLGANVTWGGIVVTNPGGAVSITAGNTISLGGFGISMGSATQNLSISSGLTLVTNLDQVWNIGASRTLTLNTGLFTRSAGATLNIQGTGTINTSNISNTSGIVGPWATVGTGASTTYATVNAGAISSYAGASTATAAAITDTTGTANYELAAGGAISAGASFNTVRYSGAADTITGSFQANGILNVGTGTLTASDNITVGSTRELVVNTATTAGGVTVSGVISNNSGGASSLIKQGAGTLALTTANTYTGSTIVSGGVLDVGTISNNALGAGGLVLNGNAVLQGNGTFTRGFGGTSTPGANQVAGQSGGFAARGGDLTLNFGGAGAQIALNTSAFIFGNNFVFGSATSDSKVIVVNPINLNSLNGVRTFTVNSGTGTDSAELQGTISENAGAVSSLTKAGTGLLIISSTNNSYTGATNITAGTLSVANIANGGTNSSLGASTNAASNLQIGGTFRYTGATATTDRGYVVSSTSSTIEVTNAATNLTISGSTTATSGALTKSGPGTLTLRGTSLQTGRTTVTGGVLDVGTISNGSLGSGGLLLTNGSVLQGNGTFTRAVAGNGAPTTNQVAAQNGGFAAKGGTLTINFGGAGAQVGMTTAGHVFGDNLVFGSSTADSAVVVVNSIAINTMGTRNITVNSGVGGDYAELQGALTDGPTGFMPSGFNKLGTGLLVLSANNTYTGATNINAGTVQVGKAGAGSTSASSSITLAGTGAVLAGSGNAAGSILVTVGAIKPGDNGGSSTGTLNTGNLTFAPSSNSTVAELQITGSASTVLSADKINIAGNLLLNGNSNVLVNGTGYTPTLGDTFTLVDWTGSVVANGFSLGTNLRSGFNGNNNEGNLDLPDISSYGYLWDIQNFSGSGSLTLAVVSVPEPGRAVMLVFGLTLACLRRKRSR